MSTLVGHDAVSTPFIPAEIGIKVPQENPYSAFLDTPFDPKLHSFPPQEQRHVLQMIELDSSSVTFIERLANGFREDAPSGVFRVRISDEGERILKIFHGVENVLPGRNFVREASAYANLLHNGACAAGVVPHCYGWTIIHQAQWQFDPKNDWLAYFRDDPLPLRALILEFLPNATQLNLHYVTGQRADAAVEALKVIHQAQVSHGDVHPRNILLLPDERVVWVDFECAMSWPWHRKLNTLRLQEELFVAWSWLFQFLIPCKWWSCIESNKRLEKEEIDVNPLEQDLIKRGFRIYQHGERVRGE